MTTTVWTVKGGRQGEREDLMLSQGVIGGGWQELGSLQGVESKDELISLYRHAYPQFSEKKASSHIGQLWSLVSRMQDGDLVVLPVKTHGYDRRWTAHWALRVSRGLPRGHQARATGGVGRHGHPA